MVSGTMEPFKAKKFVIFGPWCGLEAYANSTVKNFPENFSPSGLKLRSKNCIFDLCPPCHFFTEVNLMYSGDEDVNIPGLGCYTFCQGYFYFRLIVLI